jgi:hypothetical protein
MATYLTNDTDLGAVADAIRTKGGTSADLVFPGGFVDAISAISGGGVLGVTQDEDGYLVLSPVSSGGGNPGEEFEWASSAQIVTVGANTAASTQDCVNYFSSYDYSLLIILSPFTKGDQYLMRYLNGNYKGSFRWRGGGFMGATEASNYSAYLVEGTKYLLLKI